MSNNAIVETESEIRDQFTESIGQTICDRLREGQLIPSIAAEVGFSPATILDWRDRHKKFGLSFTRAEQIGFDMLAERLLMIPKQDGDVQRQRLESDNIKWFLSKRRAAVYGDRIDVNVTNTIDIGGALNEARARALRPMRDQQDAIDVETRAIAGDAQYGATDTQSEGPEKAPQQGGCGVGGGGKPQT